MLFLSMRMQYSIQSGLSKVRCLASFNSSILPLPSTGGAKKLLKKGRAGLLLETAKKVPDQLLVCGIGDL